MCTKDRNVYIKFVRVSNNLYYYARYLLRLWCSRMRHGGMVSRGRWDMRWWWFSLTDILIHIIHVIHTYVHTLGWGGDTPAAPTLFRFFFGFFYIHIHMLIYIYMHIYTHIYIYTHTWTYISPWPCTLKRTLISEIGPKYWIHGAGMGKLATKLTHFYLVQSQAFL